MIILGDILAQLDSAGLLIRTANISPQDHQKVVSYPLTDTRSLSSDRAISDTIRSFICIKGSIFDGHKFIPQAIDNGIKLIITEDCTQNIDVHQITVSNTRKVLARIASLYYEDPSQGLFLIGVTGTNGKTSIVRIIEQILRNEGLAVGSIGTLGYTINGQEYPLERTTPDITELHEILSDMRTQKVQYVVMEVSSHSLKLDRVYGLKFDLALFANLTREHLDFHPDMEDYYQSKKILFDYLKKSGGFALINIDDQYGNRLFQETLGRKISISEINGDIVYHIEKSDLVETRFLMEYGPRIRQELQADQNYSTLVSTPLLGKHNAFNITAALAAVTLALKNIPLQKAASFLPRAIKGRLQRVNNDHNISCFIDFAHTPDALNSVCKTIKEVLVQQNAKLGEYTRKGRFIVVIGAGGDRDRGKRSEMTDTILQYADYAFITSDNPRSENPADIVTDMTGHLHPLAHYWILLDRSEAISRAIGLTTERDVLLIAGKGHETYQVLSTGRIPFDDYQIALDAINKKFNTPQNAENRVRDLKSKLPVSNLEGYSPATIELAMALELLQVRLLLERNNDLNNYWSLNSQQTSTPENHNPERINELREAGLAEHNQIFFNISTDTRTIKDHTLFFALKGENFDGHKYLAEALKNDHNWAVVDRDFDQDAVGINSIDGQRLIRVQNVTDAYAMLAKKYRSLYYLPVIAITGSCGKTTTREYCHQVLSSEGESVLQNISNENNIIGVSKTLFRLSPTHRYAILELGSNHFGEIGHLADLTEPEIGIVTNVGPSHLEFFNDLEGVFQEKSSLLRRDLWFGIINQDDEYLARLSGKLFRITSKPDNSLDESLQRVQIEKISPDESRFIVNNFQYTIPSELEFNIKNAAFAVVLASKLGFDHDSIQKGLDRPLSLQDRMEIYRSKDRLIISDCYNANPTSMKVAIDHWQKTEPELPHIAILGDMLELGDQAEQYHHEIALYLKDTLAEFINVTQIITVGTLAKLICSDYHFSSVEELLSSELLSTIAKNAVILLKASHGIHLEKIKRRL